jgi:hypothetical protein
MFARCVLAAAVIAAAVGACDKATPENLDKWMRTEKGPDKLKKAFVDETLDADLAAHAAANLIHMQLESDVRTGLQAMSKDRRAEVVSKLAPRLWEMAKIDRDDAIPNAGQILGKDMLVEIEPFAAPADKAAIDNDLVDWFAVSSYEGRAERGGHDGASVMRLVGPPGGKKLVEVLNSIVAAPGQDKAKNRIGDNLLLGIAASGDPDGIKRLLDLTEQSRGDETLANRAMSALWTVYVSPNGLELRGPEALIPDLDRLAEIARDDKVPATAANHAVDLIAAVGAPKCIAPLVSMVSYPSTDPIVKFQAVNKVIRCAGLAGVKDAVEALPPTAPYAQTDLTGAISGEIAKLKPTDKVLATARDLLADKNPIARWVGVETLGALKSTDDAAKIAALGNDTSKLLGYWGEGVNKPDPTLGARAKAVAAELSGKQGK